jgi:hypothetical protein
MMTIIKTEWIELGGVDIATPMGTSACVDREPPSATEQVARFRLHFRQIPLAKLEEADLVALDRDEHEIRAGRRFEKKWDEISE